MIVLILEDDDTKYSHIKATLLGDISDCIIRRSEYFSKFVIESSKDKFDLIVTDFLVPMHKDTTELYEVTQDIIGTIRDIESPNFSTPVIAITGFSDVAEQNYEQFNRLDINIIHYSEDSNDWKDAFLLKIKNSLPPKKYDFVIFCALEKEAEAFDTLDCTVGQLNCIQGLSCRTIEVNDKKGVIIVPPRMGLVNAAITCSRAIDTFSPELICMSGICGGIEGKANIYDVVISEMCHQHDAGKWTSEGFLPEVYSVQVPHETHVLINQLIKEPNFKTNIASGIILKRSEFPTDLEELNFNIIIGPTSSGSSVIASEEILESVKAQHRKHASFEMESYALYEAARQSSNKNLRYFSAKSVVDNGNELKSDNFHRIACILSAKTVYELIASGV
ncbi:5'-methylthioadenosine/S-adenosylhomocysteine nucleosidase family protein [Shewanella donghaensis]|uniref:5'-methylthioadenosine/S-adenosylhomocysteine nucleosidase family protein n=1 Tax=Shewanella donghaensis TaxID=238836 RepID=UPI0011826564|nr:5'-methylthioadenosine/S-adenosylhomocysteine nucleosidase [Shewanella donghaensis]